MTRRIHRLRRLLTEEALDGLLVTQPDNVRYLSGFSGSNGTMLITAGAARFYTDFRYQERIKTEVKGCRKQVRARNLFSAFPVEHTRGIKKLGVEADHLTLGLFQLVKRQLKGVKLVPVKRNLVLELRRQKDAGEVRAIKRAQSVTDRVFGVLLDMIKPGVRERELAAEIRYRFTLAGEVAFDPIVASGPNGAKPHAGATNRKLNKGEAVTIDFGCRVDGYCSDMTRTVFLGKPDPDLLEVYNIVFEANRRGLEAAKPGAKCADVDRAARDYIRDTGYGPYFGHSLGHGVGINVHEQPVLAYNSRQTLAAGNIVTVEPGIYLPGVGGVRIEDMVAITAKGSRNLTQSPKQVIQL